MLTYTIYCTEAQTKKALELGAPIENHNYTFGNNETCTYLGKDYTKQPALDWFAQQPTAEQMLGWLEEQGVKCFICQDMYDDDSYNIQINNKLVRTGHPQYNYPLSYHFRKEATLAAIDAALEYLVDNKFLK